MTITNSKFTYNTVDYKGDNSGFGGALYNFNSDSLTITGSSFIGNEANGDDTIYGLGGAIYNNQTGSITIKDSEFLENSATNQGGALYINETGDVEITNTEFYKNTADVSGGAIYNMYSTSLTISDSTKFTENSADVNGGALYSENTGEITIDDVEFLENSADENGGAIYNKLSTSLTITDSKFDGNNAGTKVLEGLGGAIYIDETGLISIDNVEFLVNTATSGGAIYNLESEDLTIKNSKFTENVATVNGGAIHNSETLKVTNSQFTQNEAEYGGAIYDDGKEIEITGSDFLSNTAYVGGAIYSSSSDDDSDTQSTLNISSSEFMRNIATSQGGAIYNKDAKLTINDTSEFIGNEAGNEAENVEGYGGAIYSSGDTSIKNDYFSSNKATNGGAIYNAGSLTITEATTLTLNDATKGGAIYNTKEATLSNSRLTENTATSGGAIYNDGGTLELDNIHFSENTATNGGALYIDGDDSISIKDGSEFIDNTADYGGAIHVEDGNEILIDANSVFRENTARDGAAIYMVNGKVSIVSSTFKDNTASINGGAIATLGGSLTITGSTFQTNTASIEGGAVYNAGEDLIIRSTTFTENSAIEGGAISNSGTLTIESSNLYDNTAIYGGAIYISNGKVSIDASFEKNSATVYGGAVYIKDSNSVSISGSSEFTENTALYGGAIYIDDRSSITIEGATFNINSATVYGGAIYTESSSTIMIENSKFIENTADVFGGAIYNRGSLTLNGNDFIDNAGQFNETIYNSNNNLDMTDNYIKMTDYTTDAFKELEMYSPIIDTTVSTSQSAESTETIIYQITDADGNTESVVITMDYSNKTYSKYEFEDPGVYSVSIVYKGSNNEIEYNVYVYDASVIELSEVTDAEAGKDVTITGTLKSETDNFYATYTDKTVDIYANGKLIYEGYQVGSDGTFTFTYTPVSGYNRVYAVYDGNTYLLGSTGETDFSVIDSDKIPTITTIVIPEQITGDDNIVITLTEDDKTTLINDKEITITIIKDGIEVYSDDIEATYGTITISTGEFTPGTYIIEAEFGGDENYYSSYDIKSFVIEMETDDSIDVQPEKSTYNVDDWVTATITIKGIDHTSEDSLYVTVSGVDDSDVTVEKIDEETYTVTFKASTAGFYTITATYIDKDGVYQTVSDTASVSVSKIETSIEITNIDTTIYEDKVIITGQLSYEDEEGADVGLDGQEVLIYINGQYITTVQTYGDGIFTFEYSGSSYGTNTVEVNFETTNKYESSHDTTSYIIEGSGTLLTTKITFDNIADITIGETTTIIGHLTDINENPIGPTSIEVTIDGVSQTVDVDETGTFIIENYEPTKTGTITVTAQYAGDETYSPSSGFTSFNVEKLHTITIVDSIEATKGSSVILTAYVFDEKVHYVDRGEVYFMINGEPVCDSNGHILYEQIYGGVATLPYTITEDVGNYELIAVYVENDKYYRSYSDNSATLTVEQPETEMIPTITVVDSVIGVQGDTVDLVATVYDNDYELVDDGEVYFRINGVTVRDSNGNILYAQVNSGVAKLPYTITENAGSYTITAHFTGTSTYLASDSINSATLTVENSATEKISTTTIVDSISATQGETVNLTAFVYDENGKIVTEGQVSFEIDGVTITDANGNILYAEVVNGVARLPYTVTNDPNDYTIKANYQGTDTYYPSESLNDAKLSVVARPDSDKIPTTTIVDDMIVVSGSTVNLTATVYDENGYLVTDGRVSFRLNGVTIKDEEGNILYADVVNGIAKLPYTVINSPKNYTLEAIYTGSDLYLPSNSTTYANATLQVLDGRIPTSTVVDSVTGIQGETVNLTATVYDEYGDLVTEGDVLFKLNNVTIKDEDGNILYAEVVDGVAKLPYTITNNPKDYNISAVYMGTDTYMSSKSVNNATLTVEDTSKYKIPTITVVDSIIANKGDTVNLTATVFDNDGNLVCEGDVSFKLNGVTLKDEFGNTLYAQIEDGVAKMPYTITNSPKNYTITAVYQGTDTYLSSKSVNNGTLMVLVSEDKIDTTTTADGVTATPNETVNLTAEVTDENGDPVTEGEVYFEIDGEPITDEDGNIIYVPVIDGVARLPYTPEKEGNFTITARYNGTDKYAPSDAENSGTTGNLIVVDENSNVTTTITVNSTSQQYGDYVNFTATIVDEYGNKVTGGKVVFKLNGVTIKDEEGNIVYAQVVDGLATISYLVTNNVKDYQLSAVYSGSGIFDSSRSTNVTFTVTPRSVNITVDKLDNDIKSGDNVTFKATITEYDTTYTDNGVVVFKINGKTIRDEEGNPIIVDVNNGVATLDYTIPVDFAGKDYNITAVYTNNNYLRAEANNTLSTVRSNVQTELNTITVSHGEDANIYMVLYDENGDQLERDTKVAIKINGHTIIHMNTTAGVLNATIPASEITDTTNRIDVVIGENYGYYELRLNTTLTVKS